MIETLLNLVCTTDFLVHTAQQRYNCESSLRWWEYFLPNLLLDDHRLYQSEIYAIIKSHKNDFKANDKSRDHKQENQQKESTLEYFLKGMRKVKQPSITLATSCVVGLSFFRIPSIFLKHYTKETITITYIAWIDMTNYKYKYKYK